MNYDPTNLNQEAALRDFQRARQQAAMQQLMARLRGESADLLYYDDVRKKLRVAGPPIQRGLQEIPLNKIIGSVGRVEDFTRNFMPKRDVAKERWVGVKTAVQAMTGMPPIEVYQVGDAYFVQDGNHRVSIARQLGTKTISAYVTEVPTRVPLTAYDNAPEVICKSFYAEFLERTNLDKLYPDADLMMTFCDEYALFLEQIEVEKSLLATQQQWDNEDTLWETAVSVWYEQVYLPVVEIIRQVGILRRFPRRTEADLYMVLLERHDELEENLGWRVEMETAVTDLVDSEEKKKGLLGKMLKAMLPRFDPGPEPGLWRKQQLARNRHNRLFEHTLIAINGKPDGWALLDRMLEIAQFDKDHILGLYVVPSKAVYDSDAIEQIRQIFDNKVASAGLTGELAVEVSANPAQPLIERAVWADFVVALSTPPGRGEPPPLDPHIRQLVQQCPRPILIVPSGSSISFRRPILGYDGSAKAREALFLAAYLAGRWQVQLTVVSAVTQHTGKAQLKEAKKYITERGIKNATYVLKEMPIAEAILDEAEKQNSTMIIIGGFSYRPIRHLVLGSTAEKVLRESQIPVLICR